MNHTTAVRFLKLAYTLIVVGALLLVGAPFLFAAVFPEDAVVVTVFFVSLPFLLIYAGWGLMHPATTDLHKPRNTKRWLGNLALAALWAWQAQQAWKDAPTDPLMKYFLVWIFMTILLFVIVRKIVRGFTFFESVSFLDTPAGDRPRDEREAAIVSSATQVTFAINLLLTFVAAALLIFLPTPTAEATLFFFFSWLMLQLAIRDFILWRLRL